MALIKCPECGKEISNKSTTCIHCGYPLSIDTKEQTLYCLYAPMWETNCLLKKLLHEILGYTEEEINIMSSEKYDRNIVNGITLDQAKAITEIFSDNGFVLYLKTYGESEEIIFWNDLGICLNQSLPKEHYCDEPLISRKQLSNVYAPKMKVQATTPYNTKPIVECPYCHSRNTKKVSIVGKAGSVAIWGIFSQKIKKQWHCNTCGSEW